MEVEILRTLRFDMACRTSREFAQYFLTIAAISLPPFNMATFKHLINFLVELTLLDYAMALYPPSHVACAVICIAIHTLNLGRWTPHLAYVTGLSASDIRPCIYKIYEFGKQSPTQNIPAITNKYSQAKFECIATKQLAPVEEYTNYSATKDTTDGSSIV